MRFRSFSKRIVNGTTVLPSSVKRRYKTACRASRISTNGSSTKFGAIACNRLATNALAIIKSTCAKKPCVNRICGISGRTKSVIACRMRSRSRACSDSKERILLFASTTSCGSINTVFPVADSSCTMPPIFFFAPAGIGNTKRPSRNVGVASLSTNPAA